MRDLNIYYTSTGQISLSTRVVKPKKGKGSFNKKIKHKNHLAY